MKAASNPPRGVTLVEVVVVGAIVLLVVMVLLVAIPQSRENARLASCNNNLAQIGRALSQFDGAHGHYPRLPRVGETGLSPLAAFVEEFGYSYFDGDPKAKPKPLGAPATPRRVRGFVCPADSGFSQPNLFSTPTNYRGNAGPGPDGKGGAFGFGEIVSSSDADAGAGTDFTAGFAERLLGSGGRGDSALNDYQAVPGPVGADACPKGPAESWKGDAGSNWARADWISSIYNHAMTPNASPSCIASDQKSARMGASSGHVNRVNVLMLGGSVRGFTRGVDREIWRKFGAISIKERANGSKDEAGMK